MPINFVQYFRYATVKKEPPQRPPPPMRRKRSTKSLSESQSTQPTLERNIVETPERPKRNYSTITPIRPPRRASSTSLIDGGK